MVMSGRSDSSTAEASFSASFASIALGGMCGTGRLETRGSQNNLNFRLNLLSLKTTQAISRADSVCVCENMLIRHKLLRVHPMGLWMNSSEACELGRATSQEWLAVQIGSTDTLWKQPQQSEAEMHYSSFERFRDGEGRSFLMKLVYVGFFEGGEASLPL